MKKILFCTIVFLCFSKLSAQPNNYWSMGSNTEASILAGAVVGGGSGITSIFYNPAGISEISSNKISLDASLFHFNFYNYSNPFNQGEKTSFLDYEVQPRFFSFVLQPKREPKLNFQFAIFSRGVSTVKIRDFGSKNVVEPVTNINKFYTVQFEYDNKYSDNWFGAGSSYQISDNWVVGISTMMSIKSLQYYENSNISLIPIDTLNTISSKWLMFDRQELSVFSLICKLGVQYKRERWSYGVTVSLPSLRLYGDGYHRREVNMLNIFNNGIEMPDESVINQNSHLVSNFKEPFSSAFGITYKNESGKTRLFFSTEFFSQLKTYKVIDNSKISSLYKNKYSPGSDFLTFVYGSKAVINFGVGLKHTFSEKFATMFGFKTDFSPYKVDGQLPKSKLNQYQKGYADLYHLTTGVEFTMKRASVLAGFEYTFGRSKNNYQFSNYRYPGVYDAKNYVALQNYPLKAMDYAFNGIGIYLGLSFNF